MALLAIATGTCCACSSDGGAYSSACFGSNAAAVGGGALLSPLHAEPSAERTWRQGVVDAACNVGLAQLRRWAQLG